MPRVVSDHVILRQLAEAVGEVRVMERELNRALIRLVASRDRVDRLRQKIQDRSDLRRRCLTCGREAE